MINEWDFTRKPPLEIISFSRNLSKNSQNGLELYMTVTDRSQATPSCPMDQVYNSPKAVLNQASSGRRLLRRPRFPGSMFSSWDGDSDVGDIVMLVTLWWWLIWDVGGKIIKMTTFFVMLMNFAMYLIGQQPIGSPKSVTNIDVTRCHQHRCHPMSQTSLSPSGVLAPCFIPDHCSPRLGMRDSTIQDDEEV